MKPDNCVATAPDSNRSTVRFETPACVRQLCLRQIAIQPDFGQPPAQFSENRFIRGLFGYFHNTSFMANYG